MKQKVTELEEEKKALHLTIEDLQRNLADLRATKPLEQKVNVNEVCLSTSYSVSGNGNESN